MTQHLPDSLDVRIFNSKNEINSERAETIAHYVIYKWSHYVDGNVQKRKLFFILTNQSNSE